MAEAQMSTSVAESMAPTPVLIPGTPNNDALSYHLESASLSASLSGANDLGASVDGSGLGTSPGKNAGRKSFITTAAAMADSNYGMAQSSSNGPSIAANLHAVGQFSASNTAAIPGSTAGLNNLLLSNGGAMENRRRIIAEDPEWNLAPVEKLTNLCVKAIVKDFEKRPLLKPLSQKYRSRILSLIPVDFPINTAGLILTDEGYWERRSRAHFKNCKKSAHGDSWKRLYFERKIKKEIEDFEPREYVSMPSSPSTSSTNSPKSSHPSISAAPTMTGFVAVTRKNSLDELKALCKLGSSVIKSLVLDQIQTVIPPPGTVATATDPPPNHFDLSTILSVLTSITELQVYYGQRDVGMNFKQSLFGMTMTDCLNLTRCLRSSLSHLEVLTIKASHLDDDRARLIAHALLDNKTLKKLDLSHNRISDNGARGFAKLLATPSTVLTHLNLNNNKITRHGAYCLGKSLMHNTTLQVLSLRLNALTDSGAASLLASCARNDVVVGIDLSGNNVGAETVVAACALIRKNSNVFKWLDLSCNKLGGIKGTSGGLSGGKEDEGVSSLNGRFASSNTALPVHNAPNQHGLPGIEDVAGKMFFDAVSSNRHMTQLDLRSTDVPADIIGSIHEFLNENAEKLCG